jgi:hypothetical protein
LPAANSNYPSATDSNRNSGIPAAALQAQKRRFFPLYPLLFFSQPFGRGRGAAHIRSSFMALSGLKPAHTGITVLQKTADLFTTC